MQVFGQARRSPAVLFPPGAPMAFALYRQEKRIMPKQMRADAPWGTGSVHKEKVVVLDTGILKNLRIVHFFIQTNNELNLKLLQNRDIVSRRTAFLFAVTFSRTHCGCADRRAAECQKLPGNNPIHISIL